MRYILTLLFATPYFCQPVFAVTTKTLQGDTWKNNALTKTWTPPSITDTLAGLADIQTFTNKVINGSNNTITNISLSTAVTGTLPITSGGTGQTSASAAFDALAPSQGSNSGKYLTTNGTTTSWGTVDALPSQSGNNGKYLTTDGSASSWSSISLSSNVTGTLPIASGGTGQTGANAAFNALAPSQGSNSGKFLTTNGTDTSWATAALTAQGQSEGSGVTTTTIKSPYNQITTTGTDTRLIETGYNNLLLNPSFEGSTATTSWTQGSGTSCAAETTEISDGAKSLLCTLTAATAASVYQDVTPTVKMSGINFEYGVWIKTASTTLSVCARQAAATVGSCTTVIGDDVWHYYPINYPGPSSGSVGVAVVPLSSTTGTYYIDAGYVGKARNIGTVAQASFFGGMEQAGAGSCVYSENTSTGLSDFDDLGAGSGCNAWTTSGSVTATGTNDHRPVLSNLAPGNYQVMVAGTFLNDTANQLCSFRLSDGTTTYQPQGSAGPNAANGVTANVLNFSVPYTTAQSSITLKLQAADNGAGSCSIYNVVNLNASWKIYYFPSAAQTVVRMDQAGWYVDATMDGANPDLGVSSVTSYTEITNASLTLTPRSGSAAVGTMCSSTNAATSPSTSATTCAAGSESVGINFSIPLPGAYEVCWYGAHYKVVDANEAINSTFQLIETPTNAQTLTLEGGSRQLSSSGNSTTGLIDVVVTDAITSCSIFNWGSTGTKGVRLMYEQAVSGTPDTSLLFGDADPGTGQRNMRFTVKPITQAMNMPLLVGGVTSNTTGMERVERARLQISSASACSVISESGDWLGTCTASGSDATIPINSGIFSSAPSCAGIGRGSANAFVRYGGTMPTTSSLSITHRDTSNAASTAEFDVICMGPR